MEFLPWTPLQHPLLPTSVAPLQQTWWCWNLGRTFYTSQTKTDLNLTQIQWWIWEEQLIEPKIQRLCYKYLLQHNFLPCLILAHTFSMNTSPHIRIKNPSSHFILFFFSFPHTHKILFLGKLPWPSLSLFPLSNESFEIPCSNQWPPHPSKANENWE